MYINDIERGQTVFFTDGNNDFMAVVIDVIPFAEGGPEAILIITESFYESRKIRKKIEDLYPTRREAIKAPELKRVEKVRKYKAAIGGTADLISFLFGLIADETIEPEKLEAAIQSATEMGYKIDNKTWVNFINTWSGIAN